MILNEFIELKITRKNIEHYIKWYTDINLGDIIKVDPNNLQKSCGIKIDVSCDICGIKRTIKFQAYTKNINSCPEYPIYTCDKCSHIKIKEYNKKKWGVEYFSQTKEWTSKFKKTMIERWGVEHALQSDDLKEKVKKTNLEKFGVENPFMDNDMIRTKFKEKWGEDHPSKIKSIYDKIKKTNLEKLGYECPLSSPEIREKSKRTNLEKWGNEHPVKTKKIYDKIKKTNLEKWGVEFTLQNKKVRDKIKKTNLEKWGVVNPIMSDELRSKFKISKDINYLSYGGSSLCKMWCDKGHEYQINTGNYASRVKNKTPLCTVCYPIGNHRSIKEEMIYNYISSIYSGEIIQSYRDGLEIDIYLPDLKIGFEFNGLYWHSEERKSKYYHLEKTKYFKERGIRIIHIWEDDWNLRSDIVKSQISNWLGLTVNKIFARKCEVRVLDNVSDFLNKNHIQGVDHSSLKLGLFHNEDLVSVMTFNQFEGRKKMESGGWNLSRFCVKLGFSVVGGASKLLDFFIKCWKPNRIVSYADRDWSCGDLYLKLGFGLISESRPDYKYLVGDIRVHKSNFKKKETDYVQSLGYSKVWDCGKIKFERILN
jgi:hypothetical protein